MDFREKMEQIFDGHVREQNATAERDGNYFVDGLLYCGKCKTPKQCLLEVNGEMKVRAINCKCESERIERERKEEEESKKQNRINALKRRAFPDSNMATWTFENDDGANPKYIQIAKRYVENFDEMLKCGKGLLLYGTVGTGKTFLSACIANALLEQERSCLVTNFARIVNTMQGMFNGKQEYLDSLNKYQLLVLDDLAAERDTEFMNEMVMSVVDSRYRIRRPLIVTTNLTSQELRTPSDVSKQRVYSRLLEMCVPIEISGTDRRKQKLKDDYDHMKELLGL